MHRRAVELTWWRWDFSGFMPSTWEILPPPPADTLHSEAASPSPSSRSLSPSSSGTTVYPPSSTRTPTLPPKQPECSVRCVRRPPFFEELASPELMAVEWRHAYSSAIHRAAPTLPPSVLRRVSDVDDYKALLSLYASPQQGGWLAVLLEGGLPERMLHLCAARAVSAASALNVRAIPESDLQVFPSLPSPPIPSHPLSYPVPSPRLASPPFTSPCFATPPFPPLPSPHLTAAPLRFLHYIQIVFQVDWAAPSE